MIIGLDIGTKRIGVATSEGTLASEYATWPNDASFLSRLTSLCEEIRATIIVVGLPLQPDGTESEQTRYVKDIAKQIEAIAPVVFENEILTTAEANRLMTEAGVPAREREERIDQYSAKLILEQYINRGGEV